MTLPDDSSAPEARTEGVWSSGTDGDYAEQSRPAAARLDAESARSGLVEWAARVRPGKTVTGVHLAEGNGMSSETVLFDLDGPDGDTEHLVARVAPLPESLPVFPRYDMETQAAVMRLVASHSRVPVPEIVDVHTEPDLLGMPFFVMARRDGEALADIPPYTFEGFLHEADDRTRAALRDATVDVVAGVHSVPVDAIIAHSLGFDSPPSAQDALAEMLRAEREYYEWARTGGPRSPLIERGLDWLEANQPAEPGPAVLSWGDSRPANILWTGGTEVSAVLDWEMATLAPRGSDLGWMVFVHDFFQFIAEMFEMPGLPGLFDADDVAARYAERTGVDIDSLDYYRAYGTVRHAIIMYRIALRSIQFGAAEMPDDPDQLVMHRPMVEELIGESRAPEAR